MALQLLVDFYGCDFNTINDVELLRSLANSVVSNIGSRIVDDCSHIFEPQGITYIAVITKSHFSIHTWPENGYAAVDIFSCDDSLPDEILHELQIGLKAKDFHVERINRNIINKNDGKI